MFVPVCDSYQKPLMPTTPARARRWIKSGKATAFWEGGMFCVRLNVEPSDHVLQPIALGTYLPQYPGRSQRACQGCRRGEHQDAANS